MAGKSVLIAGIDPELVDYSAPGLPPGLNAAKVHAGLKAHAAQLVSLGYSTDICYTDTGETAAETIAAALKAKSFDCVMIGAGIRTPLSNLVLFEKVINAVHAAAPRTKICFNATPMDIAEAVQRWV
jgi:hypothetical protein